MKTKIFLLLVLCFLCTGCWNYHELSDFAIITGIGIDKDDDIYNISMMIANASNSNSSTKEGDAVETIVTGKGLTITDAINDIEKKISKDIYTGHLSLLLINEDIAKESIYDVLDPIVRDPESIKKIFLVIAKDVKAKDILKTISPLDSFSVENIINNLEIASNNMGFTSTVTLSEFISNIVNTGNNNIMPSVTISGKNGSTDNIDDLKKSNVSSEIKLSNLAIFKDYKLIKYIDVETSKGINIINNKVKSMSLTTSCYKDLNKYIVTKIDNPKTKIDLVKEKDKLTYKIDVTASGSINETNCILDMQDEKVIENINNSVKSNIYDIISDALKVSTKNKTDIYGLGNMLYKKDYKYWYKIKDDFNDILNKTKFIINVDLDLKTKGSLETTIKEKEHEKN